MIEDQMNEMKREEKCREKTVKRNEQSLQEIWDYVKRPNLRLFGVNVKGSQGERLGYPQREAHQTNSRSLGRNSTSQKRVGANIQHS